MRRATQQELTLLAEALRRWRGFVPRTVSPQPQQFDQNLLAIGIRVELNYTRKPEIALKNVMAHLSKDPLYYDKLLSKPQSSNPPPDPNDPGWSIYATGYFAVDPLTGNDANTGFSLVSPQDAQTRAIKTLTRLSDLISSLDGRGRKFTALIRSGSYVDQDLRVMLQGWTRAVFRATDDDPVSGAVAFSDSAIDKLTAGFKPALGTDAAGYTATLTNKAITAITLGAPMQVTSVGHGLSTGDCIWIDGVTGCIDVNAAWFVTRVDNDKFTLDGSHGLSTPYAGGATFHVYRIKTSTNATPTLPAFPALTNKRARFSPTAATASLQNAFWLVHLNGPDTIVPAYDLDATPTAPTSGDIFYIEEPGVKARVVDILGANAGMAEPNDVEPDTDFPIYGLPTDQYPELAETVYELYQKNGGIQLVGLVATDNQPKAFSVTGAASVVRIAGCEIQNNWEGLVPTLSSQLLLDFYALGPRLLTIGTLWYGDDGLEVDVGTGFRSSGEMKFEAIDELVCDHFASLKGLFLNNIRYGCQVNPTLLGRGVDLESCGTAGVGIVHACGGMQFGSPYWLRQGIGLPQRRTRIIGFDYDGSHYSAVVWYNTFGDLEGIHVVAPDPSDQVLTVRVAEMSTRLAMNDCIGWGGASGVGISTSRCTDCTFLIGQAAANTLTAGGGDIESGPTYRQLTVSDAVDHRGNRYIGSGGRALTRLTSGTIGNIAALTADPTSPQTGDFWITLIGGQLKFCYCAGPADIRRTLLS